jgi:hypothetical protein
MFKGQEMQIREHTVTEINWHNFSLWDLTIICFLKEAQCFETGSVSILQALKYLTWWTP